MYIRSCTNSDGWRAWRKIVFTDSPAFSGTPTAPTPGTSDNGTRIATTAFVHALLGQRGNTVASKAENGYWKDNYTGLIYQWGREASFHDISSSSTNKITFPISFPNKCLCVIPYMIAGYIPCSLSVKSYDQTSVTVLWEEWRSDTQSVKAGYLAIGY